jgi:hypothetical protein
MPLMSKFSCTCGHVIRDQTDNLPYKGQILKNQDWESFFSRTVDTLTEYLAGVRSGDLAEWHHKWPFLRGKTDNHVAWPLLGWFWRKFSVDVYECEQCGRLWVQAGIESQRFIPFIPEEASAGRVLPSKQFQAIVSPGDGRAEPEGIVQEQPVSGSAGS